MYIYEGCFWPPQRITGDGYRMFAFGRELPPETAEREFCVDWKKHDAKLIELVSTEMTWQQIADYFYTTKGDVRGHYRSLVRRGLAPLVDKRTEWKPEEEQYLLEHLVRDGVRNVARILHRSRNGLALRARRLGFRFSRKDKRWYR